MAIADLFRRKARLPVSRRRRRKTEAGSVLLHFLETSRVIGVGVFFLTVAAIFTISFVGVSPAGFHILPNQIASVRIVAETDFSYESPLLTERKKRRRLQEVPPVLRIDLSGLEKFEQQIRELGAKLNHLDARWQSLNEADRMHELTSIADSLISEGGPQVSVRDLVTLMNYGDAAAREKLISTGLFILREIHRPGILDPEQPDAPIGDGSMMVFRVVRESGELAQSRAFSLDEALTFLRANLQAENLPPAVTNAMQRLLRPGIRGNLIYDSEKTDELRATIAADMKPEIRHVEAGQSIIEPDTRVTQDQYEMLNAYQHHLNQANRLPTGINRQMISRVLLVLAMIIVAGFYIRLEDPVTLQSNGRLALLALVLVFSLSLVRMILEAGNSPLFSISPETAALLPYLAPTAFAPMIVAVLIGAGPALFSGLLVSVFAAIIFGNRLDILVLSLLTASVAAFACRAVRRRSRVIRAGWLSGLTLSVFVLLLGLADRLSLGLMAKAIIGGQLTGFLTGVVVVGLLPLLEALFKRTTDITLIELSDYNHPLLRRMQMDAPGTYHHSLMVANLSENAANAIGANALLCRVCSMFHDIGKLVKPEYFIENQRGGINPHADRTPSFSALIIKSHVKEGLDLAIKYKLPRPVIDIIRQHHGTTLIRYFYEQARERARRAIQAGTSTDPNCAVESSFRYDGPRPQFKESAVILFADSVEAASRSLQKVTPQAVEDLIDAIIRDKIDDGQIDDAPLTIREVALIKRSFTFTLLNSLHSRIVYPKTEKPAHVRPVEREPRAVLPEHAPTAAGSPP